MIRPEVFCGAAAPDSLNRFGAYNETVTGADRSSRPTRSRFERVLPITKYLGTLGA